jgi:hypothetical protein
MADKGHQKMRFDGETLLEYADFYSYGDEDDEEDESSLNVADYDMLNQSELDSRRVSLLSTADAAGVKSVFEDENYELVLPAVPILQAELWPSQSRAQATLQHQRQGQVSSHRQQRNI